MKWFEPKLQSLISSLVVYRDSSLPETSCEARVYLAKYPQENATIKPSFHSINSPSTENLKSTHPSIASTSTAKIDEKHKPTTLDITEMPNLNPNTTVYQP